ncbi:RimK family alpha-L-glutamate ligase [Candidatus Bathyarchaeota archaeon]|nr:RimK family alpha-L-glutamate ligase [Candidatus Bathyarchaeota archaeon]MBS7631060.1 RimK family alpha-L-glutamate ligase [Candidatus Bathyarchaeota archaeon]
MASERGEWHVQQLQESLKRRRVENYVFPADRFLSRIELEPRVSVKGYSLEDFDALIVRKIPGGTAEQVFYRMDVLHRLEKMGVKIVNPPKGIEKAVDKYYTCAILEEVGIKTPRTIVTERFDEAIAGFEELGGDVVVKPLFGSLGTGIVRINDIDVAQRVFRALEMANCVYYLQEFIPHGNHDIRVFVIDGRVIASMLRLGSGWKTNISKGAAAKLFEVNETLAKMSIEATDSLGLFYSGVDILKSELDGSYYVVELNSTPGWQGLQTVTDFNIAEALVSNVMLQISKD